MDSRQSVVEVLKHLSVHDVLTAVSTVSRRWSSFTNAEDLWFEFLELASIAPRPSPKLHYRQATTSTLAVLQSTEVTLVNCWSASRKVVVLKKPVKVSWSSSHAFIDRTHIVTSGHQSLSTSAEAFIIDCTTGDTQQIESMNVPRVGHALIVVDGVIYAFGGFGPLQSSEKRKSGPWQQLPDMCAGHAWLNACCVRKFIYLCGGCTAVCEKFCIESELFSAMKVRVPCPSLSVCVAAKNDCLLVVQERVLLIVSTATEKSSRHRLRTSVDIWPNSPPIVIGDKIIAERDQLRSKIEYDLSTLMTDSSYEEQPDPLTVVMESRQSVLEVFKFLPAKDALANLCLVSRHWSNLSNSEELWFEYLELADFSPNPNPKLHYRQLAMRRLAIVEPTRVTIVNCLNLSKKVVTLASQFAASWNSSHAFIDSTHLISCGHQVGPISPEAFVIDCEAGTVQQIESMTEPRVGHGVIVVKGVVYVFGGYGPLKSCEKRTNGPWQRLSDMCSGHSWFNPCRLNEWIYLCGGAIAACEKFHLDSEQCSEMKVKLPEPSSSVCVAVSNGAVLIVQSHSLIILKPETEEWDTATFSTTADTWPNSIPVVVGKKIIAERDESRSTIVYDISEALSELMARLLG